MLPMETSEHLASITSIYSLEKQQNPQKKVKSEFFIKTFPITLQYCWDQQLFS